MASSSRKKIFCIFHVGGDHVKTLEGEAIHDGRTISGRLITKGMSYEELRRLVATDMWPENNGFNMNYTISYAEDTPPDLAYWYLPT